MRRKLLLSVGSAAMLILAAGVILMTLALHRYGGIEGVTDRVRIQFATERPHDDFVPTPETLAALPDPERLAAAATVKPVRAAVAPEGAAPSSEHGLTQMASLIPDGPLPSRPRPTKTAQPSATPTRRPVAPARQPVAPAMTAPATAISSSVATSTFPPTARLEGLAHYWQTWNNCGPATLSTNLSYFGVKIGQDTIGAALKPERDDKNVGPEQLAEYAHAQGLRALVRVNGDAARVKALLQAGVPVLVETWYEPKPNDGMGHYRLIVGYDDAPANGAGHWIAYDSYDSHGIKKGDPYRGVHFEYGMFDQLWKVFGRTYVPIYDEARAAAVEQVLGADLDDNQMWQRALAADLEYVKAHPQDAFGWFNVGTDYVNLGDYQAAAQAYDAARQLKLPWRMLWYQFGPFQAYYEVGRHQEVINLADATIKTAVNDEELFYWKGLAQQALGDPASARASLSQAVKLRPTYQDAVDALAKLQ